MKVAMMRILVRIIIRIAVLTLTMVAQNRGQAATPTDPSGTFLTEDGRARVRVEHCGSAPERICGYIVWMMEATDAKGQPLLDKLNPDPAKRSRPLLGHQLIFCLRPSTARRWGVPRWNRTSSTTAAIARPIRMPTARSRNREIPTLAAITGGAWPIVTTGMPAGLTAGAIIGAGTRIGTQALVSGQPTLQLAS